MKKLLNDYGSMIILQGFTFAVPLGIFAISSQNLGLVRYGLVLFAQSFAMIAFIFVEFGFALYATKEVALFEHNPKKVGQLASAVFLGKFLLAAICAVFYVATVYGFDKLRVNADLFLISYLMVISQILIPTWLFLGLGKARHLVIVKMIAQFCTLGFVFFWVTSEQDYLLIPVAYALGHLIASTLSLLVFFKLYKLRFYAVTLARIFYVLRHSSHYFLSRFFYDGSQHFVITLLGFMPSSEFVTYYAAAEKFYMAITGLFAPMTQVLYPYMAKSKNVQVFKKIMMLEVLIVAMLGGILYFTLPILTVLLTGQLQEDIIVLSAILALAGIVSVQSMFLGYPLLGAFGHQKHANNSVIVGSAIYVTLAGTSIYFTQNIYYVAVSYLVFHTLVLIYRFFFVIKHRIFVIELPPTKAGGINKNR